MQNVDTVKDTEVTPVKVATVVEETPVQEVSIEQDYFFPDTQVTIKATSLSEAQTKLEEYLKTINK